MFLSAATIGILFFYSWRGYLGIFLKKLPNFIFNPIYLKSNIFIILMLILFAYIWYINVNILYCLDDETAIKIANANSNNNKRNIIGSVATSIGGLGVGLVIAKGVSAVISSPIPLSAKVGICMVGGVAGQKLFASLSAKNTKVKKTPESIPYSNDNDGSYPASSMLDSGDDNFTTMGTIIDLIDYNLILNICIYNLLFVLLILFITSKARTNQLSLIFIKNNFGERIHNFVIKILSFTSKSNKAWIIIILILLILACLSIIYIAQFLI